LTTNKIQELEAECAALRILIADVQNLMYESRGVDGWHLNGEIALWDEFEITAEIALALDEKHSMGLALMERVRRLEAVVGDARHARDMIRYLQGSGWDNLECRKEVSEVAGDLDTSLFMLEERPEKENKNANSHNLQL